MNLSKLAGRWVAVGGVLLAVVLLAGCKTDPQKAFRSMQVPPMPTSDNEPIKPGEMLTIVFADTPTALPSFEGRVKEDGTITLLFSQSFTAAGKTPGALEKEIRERYVPKYFKYMTATVKLPERQRLYFVGGEVKQPGVHPYVNNLTVLKAIQSSGDFSEFANKKKVKLFHMDGRIQIVNCVKALTNPALDLEVLPGDKIHVPRKLW